MSTESLKVVPLHPTVLTDIPGTLRNLADAIERGDYGVAKRLVWVLEREDGIQCGLIGSATAASAETYYLLALAQRGIG